MPRPQWEDGTRTRSRRPGAGGGAAGCRACSPPVTASLSIVMGIEMSIVGAAVWTGSGEGACGGSQLKAPVCPGGCGSPSDARVQAAEGLARPGPCSFLRNTPQPALNFPIGVVFPFLFFCFVHRCPFVWRDGQTQHLHPKAGSRPGGLTAGDSGDSAPETDAGLA